MEIRDRQGNKSMKNTKTKKGQEKNRKQTEAQKVMTKGEKKIN